MTLPTSPTDAFRFTSPPSSSTLIYVNGGDATAPNTGRNPVTCNATWRWTTNRRRVFGYRPCGAPAVTVETHPAGQMPRCIEHAR